MIEASMKKLLVERAIESANNAYSPYSGFRVGAAVLCSDGSIYTGCNIENSSYSATVCAERVALFSAVNDGKRGFLSVAVAGGREVVGDEVCPPCGVCLQALSEFFSPESVVLLACNGGYKEYKFKELLPLGFSSSNLDQ